MTHQHKTGPRIWRQQMGSGVRLVNLGIPGILLHQALSVEVPIALDAHPDLVTIWLAVNDLASNVPIASYSNDLDATGEPYSGRGTTCTHSHCQRARLDALTLFSQFR